MDTMISETADDPDAHDPAAVLAPVKECPGNVGARRADNVPGILDGYSTLQPRGRAGRDGKMLSAEPKDGHQEEDSMPSVAIP